MDAPHSPSIGIVESATDAPTTADCYLAEEVLPPLDKDNPPIDGLPRRDGGKALHRTGSEPEAAAHGRRADIGRLGAGDVLAELVGRLALADAATVDWTHGLDS